MEQMFRVSSYYNEREDQGMHACNCGVTLEKGDFEEMMADVITQVISFSDDFAPLDQGTWDIGYGDRKDNEHILFVTWHHDSDDRCFGIEIERLN